MEENNIIMTGADLIKKKDLSSLRKKSWHDLEDQRIIQEGGKNPPSEKQVKSALIQDEDYNELKKRSYFLQNEVERLWNLIEYIAKSQAGEQQNSTSQPFKNR